jgi:hypothetical protein
MHWKFKRSVKPPSAEWKKGIQFWIPFLFNFTINIFSTVRF